LGRADWLVRDCGEPKRFQRGMNMAEQAHPTATEMDYPAHERNYSGFLTLFKYGAIACAVVGAVVIYIIAN